MSDSGVAHNDDYSKVVITNDYPTLIGGTWTAQVVDGQTVITNGSQTYTGPVNLVGGSLTIQNGAVVDGLVAIPNGTTRPTITVNRGGTLQNSNVFRGNVSIAGVSQDNTYVSNNVTMVSGNTANSTPGGTSSHDSFYVPPSSSTGELNLSQNTGLTTFNPSTGGGNIQNPGNAQNVNINNPTIVSTSPTATTNNIYLGYSSGIGDITAKQDKYNPQFDQNFGFTLTNDNPVYRQGGTWVAYLGSDGVTYYSPDNKQTNYTGPLNLTGAGILNIEAGAVVDGVTITGGATTTINNRGTIQNSFVANGYFNNYSGGVSQNNTYLSEYYNSTGASTGGTTKNDFFYEPGPMYGNYNFSQAPDLTTFYMADGAGPINLQGSTVEGSYFGSGPNGYYTVQQDANSTVKEDTTIPCFLANTLIKTVKGLVAVEDICVGDLVIVDHHGQEEVRHVVWTGYNSLKVNTGLSADKAHYPIRITQGALDENLPFKDLLITQEHCLLIEGQFIPARMLVNNSTIYYDDSITEYTFYHFETENHSAIIADGVLTESYLDTGNRSGFISNDNIISIVNKHLAWNIDSAAPLATNREIVEPVYRKLLNRADQLGYPLQKTNTVNTHDHGLYLVTNEGDILHATYHNKDRFVFNVPSQVVTVQLMSRTSQPSVAIGPFVDDRRHLGVLVGDVTLLEGNNLIHIDEHIRSETLQGWDVQEQSYSRWTNGNAKLSIRQKPSNSIGMLVIHILAGGPYVISHEHEILPQQVS